jgi:hypothetical protein
MNMSEHQHTILGVEGRMFARHVWPQSTSIERARGLFSSQTWGASRVRGHEMLSVSLRFDDNCKNGHHSFAITADLKDTRKRGDAAWLAGGCLHDDIARWFPELAPLIKWHLFDTSGPMHYVANTVHHASDRDCWGYRKGEACRWEEFIYFGTSPVSHSIDKKLRAFIQARMTADQDGGHYLTAGALPFVVRGYAHDKDPKTYGTHYTFEGFGEKWHECPFRSEVVAQEWATALNGLRVEFHRNPTEYSEGKKRELDHARSTAVWPEATDAELCQEPEALKAMLLARLPGLVAAFRADMEACGFAWEAPQS